MRVTYTMRGDSVLATHSEQPPDLMLRRLLSGILALDRTRSAAALSVRPSRNSALISEAKACHVTGNLQRAEALYRQALLAEPETMRCWQLLGTLCAQTGRLDEGRTCLERAVLLDPGSAPAQSDLGQVHRLAGARGNAVECFRRALDLDSSLLPARLGLAGTLAEEGDHETAIEMYLRWLDDPMVPDEVVRALVELLDRLGRQAQGQAACEAVLRRSPDHVQAHASLGFLMVKRTFDTASGLRHLDVALRHRPRDIELHVTRSIALRDLGRIDEAIEACDRALSLDEGNAMARFHRAIARLLRRDFGRGWPDYEARMANEVRPGRTFAWPRWTGEELADKTILVYSEQGIGDEIMFSSCIPDIAARAEHVLLECSPKVHALFARSFPGVMVRPQGQASLLPEMPVPHYVVPLGSLPLHLRPDEQAFGRSDAFLRADPTHTQEYRRRIEALGPGLAVGLSWQGGTIESRRALRSIELQEIFPALDLPGIHWISLQYDASAAEVDRLGRACGVQLHHWQDAIDDYDRTAALVCALDLVISVCTAVVHLGGALGRPVWVAAHRSPEWRYGIEGETMPWYGSVRIFRQSVAGHWTDVIERIAKELGEACRRPADVRHASVQ